ncbi:hypothetical protein [Streptomyces sp.]|uniref:hypothetical protein n=1 Tax=Streptomyces sp. TaxID=1931 RepID=UPI002D8035EE|nr:hypothetical protein [Streptomyces sp.]
MDALGKIKAAVIAEKKIDKYSFFPALKSVGEGQYIQLESDYGVPNYGRLFESRGRWNTKPYVYEDLAGYSDLLSYVRAHSVYAPFNGWEGDPSDRFGPFMLEAGVADLVLEVAARHAQVKGFEWDESFTLSRYLEMERWWQSEPLEIRLCVPILNVSFLDDVIPLDGNVQIRRITDQEHLERLFSLEQYKRDWWSNRAATHALFIDDAVTITYPRRYGGPVWGEFLYAIIDRAMQAISVRSDFPVGYQQICYEPIGWSSGYRAGLGQLQNGFSIARYSKKMDERAEAPAITFSSEAGGEISQYFVALADANPQVSLAASRLQLATLRDDELDEIVDLCVGIEALLGGTKAGDTTYKIGIRGAAILAREGFEDSAKTAGLIKKVYAYRSLIVHGQVKYEKKRIIKLGGEEFLATDIADYLLRQLLKVILKAPSVIDQIDDDRVVFEVNDQWVKRGNLDDATEWRQDLQ